VSPPISAKEIGPLTKVAIFAICWPVIAFLELGLWVEGLRCRFFMVNLQVSFENNTRALQFLSEHLK
jgi:Zn-dependent membrane protease YugP